MILKSWVISDTLPKIRKYCCYYKLAVLAGYPRSIDKSMVPLNETDLHYKVVEYLTIIPRARTGSESIAHEFDQLVGQKYRE